MGEIVLREKLKCAERLSRLVCQMAFFLSAVMIAFSYPLPACAASKPEPSALQLNREAVPYSESVSMRYYNAGTSGWIAIYQAGKERKPVATRRLEEREGSVSIPTISNELLPGEYTAVLYRGESSEIARQDFSVIEQDFCADRESYAPGSDGYFYYDASDAQEGAWIGIYDAGEDPAEVPSLLWGYLPEGSSQIYTGSLNGNETRFSSLPAGSYQAVLYRSEYGEPYQTFRFAVADPEGLYAVYQRPDGALPNTAEGEVALLGGELSGWYWIYWGDENGAFEDYLPAGSIQAEEGNVFVLHPNQEAPYGSTRLYLYEGTAGGKAERSVPVTVMLPEDISGSREEMRTSFVVMSDIHVGQSEAFIYNRRYRQAMEGVADTMPEAVFNITLGDVVNNGRYAEYQVLQDYIAEYRDEVPEQYFLMGNHDMMLNQQDNPATQIRMWEEATGMPNVYYSFVREGYSFIVLGSEGSRTRGELATDEAWLSDGQLDWLREELAAAAERAPDQPIFVFMHQPLQDTGPGTSYAVIVQNDELAEILCGYPQVIYFSGHTHYTMNEDDVVLAASEGKPDTVHAGSVSNLWNDEGPYVGSEGCLVEIYDEYVRIRGRDFEKESWMGSAQYVLYTK